MSGNRCSNGNKDKNNFEIHEDVLTTIHARRRWLAEIRINRTLDLSCRDFLLPFRSDPTYHAILERIEPPDKEGFLRRTQPPDTQPLQRPLEFRPLSTTATQVGDWVAIQGMQYMI